jgi:hypothetical protein
LTVTVALLHVALTPVVSVEEANSVAPAIVTGLVP